MIKVVLFDVLSFVSLIQTETVKSVDGRCLYVAFFDLGPDESIINPEYITHITRSGGTRNKFITIHFMGGESVKIDEGTPQEEALMQLISPMTVEDILGEIPIA